MDTSWEKINWGNEKLEVQSRKKRKNIVEKSNTKIKEIICVLAGGLQDNSEPHEFVKKRLDKAFEFFHKKQKNNKSTYILILGGGTYHKPPCLNKDQFTIHESSSCAVYLHQKGVPSEFILREWSSYDTIANGFFAFTNYLNYLTDIEKMTLVTSDFHMERVKVIFNYFNVLFNRNVLIKYVETKSLLDLAILKIRNSREKASRINFMKNIVDELNTPQKFIKWFYTEHKAYKSIIKYEIDSKINTTY